MSHKPDIRKVSFAYRDTLTPDDVQQKSALVVSQLATVISMASSDILSYTPLLAQSELDPHLLERALPGSRFTYVEPRSNARMPEGQFTHIIVPCVAADKFGYRLGYGQGWYDRFLLQQPEAIAIGVCYENCIVDKLPSEPHDIALRYIVTETRIITPSVE